MYIYIYTYIVIFIVMAVLVIFFNFDLKHVSFSLNASLQPAFQAEVGILRCGAQRIPEVLSLPRRFLLF
jgi:hypothetical protein